jgi:AAA domain
VASATGDRSRLDDEAAAREKTGKGTFVMYLLGKLERREPTVFGPAASDKVTALIYTEEPEDSLHDKLKSFGLERATVVFHWELRSLSWKDVAKWLVAKAVRQGHGLLFVDNISRATGTEEEAGTELARKAEQLSDLAQEHGLAVLIDHHHPKSGGKLEDRSRGGTALAGACENNVELERKGDWESRERHLSSRGRVSATIWSTTLELSADGTDYTEATGEDFKVRVLREREKWTAEDFGEAIGRDVSTARKWLNDSPLVSREEGRRGGRGGSAAVIYRVTAPRGPERPAI